MIDCMEQYNFLAIQNLFVNGSIFGVSSGTLMLPERTLLVESFATGATRKGMYSPIMSFKSPCINKEPLTGRTEAVLSAPLMGFQRILLRKNFDTIRTSERLQAGILLLESMTVDKEFITG